MRDLIDERNYREKSSRSIVKGYNVHYMTPEELAEQERLKNQAEEHLQEPKAVEEEPKAAESEILPEENAVSADPVTQEQIEKILGEREEQYQNMIDEIQHQ